MLLGWATSLVLVSRLTRTAASAAPVTGTSAAAPSATGTSLAPGLTLGCIAICRACASSRAEAAAVSAQNKNAP